jgi:hypothetical protein
MWKLWRKRNREAFQFSASPGCFEAHLLRRLNNPIFPSPRRSFSEQELKQAQAADKRDAQDFENRFKAHINEGLRLQDQVETLGYVDNYLRRTFELMERLSSLGGNHQLEMETLEAAVDACVELLRSTLGKETVAELEKIRAIHNLQIKNTFLAQSFRSDSPIPQENLDEWTRALLSEDDQTIESTAMIAGAVRMEILERARAILREAMLDGLPAAEAQRKLSSLEFGYENAQRVINSRD